jgi:hypothetical protein|nr:hypothetical protein [Kofleriaceae bacterium]
MTRLAYLIAGLALASASTAAADPNCPGPSCTATCDTLSLPPIVYFQTGDTQTNLMKAMGRKLRDNTPRPLTIGFITSGSCTNIQEAYHKTAAISATISYAPSTAEVATWDAGSAAFTCKAPANTFPDVDNSAVFNSACTSEAPPNNVVVNNGPIQAYVMAVPELSDQTAMTAEEAYFVWGFGMAGMISPWTDESNMFMRTVTKSTQITWSDSIGVPPNRWKGSAFDQSAQVLSSLQNSQKPEAAIGILGDEVYDGARDTLNVLAFRAYGQYAAYYPDSTFTSHDKKNLRDGHYTVWSPTTYMNYIDPASGAPLNDDAQYIIDLIIGEDSNATPAPNFAASDVVASVGLVPDCAMQVQRAFDGGPLSLYSAPESCKCRYEATVDTSTCATCDDSTPCSTGVCRDGYCEAN